MKLHCRGLATEVMASKSAIDPVQADALDKDMCLLVNEDDKYIGHSSKRNCHKVQPDGSILLHRAFSVFLFNERGDMLMQKRASNKVTYADHYTNACCSHPLLVDNKEEDVVTAARRRLNFELGIPMEELDPKLFYYLTRIHYMDPGDGVWGEHEIDYILFLQANLTIKPNPDEVSELLYIPKNEFNSFVPTLEDPMTPWFNLIRRYRLKQWWDNLSNLDAYRDHEKIYKLN